MKFTKRKVLLATLALIVGGNLLAASVGADQRWQIEFEYHASALFALVGLFGVIAFVYRRGAN